jgi:hypothetical protein
MCWFWETPALDGEEGRKEGGREGGKEGGREGKGDDSAYVTPTGKSMRGG